MGAYTASNKCPAPNSDLAVRDRHKYIMLQKFLIILSGNSFFLPIIPKIMLTTPMIPQIIPTITQYIARVHCL